MNKSLAVVALFAVAIPCVAQSGRGPGGPGTGAPGLGAAAGTPSAESMAALRGEYLKFEAQLKAEATKSGVAGAYEKFLTADYTFVRTNKVVVDRAKFLADAKTGKAERPVDGVDAASFKSRTAEEAAGVVTFVTKTEQSYRQDYTMPGGKVEKGAKITRDLNVTETFVRANGGLQLKKTDLTDLKLYVNGTLTPTP